jgi:hypothetical protein
VPQSLPREIQRCGWSTIPTQTPTAVRAYTDIRDSSPFLPFSCHLPQNVSLCWKKHRSIERKDARTVIHKSSVNSANVAHLRHELPHVLRPRARSRLSRAGQTGAVDEHFYGTGLLLPGNFHVNGPRGIAGAA